MCIVKKKRIKTAFEGNLSKKGDDFYADKG